MCYVSDSRILLFVAVISTVSAPAIGDEYTVFCYDLRGDVLNGSDDDHPNVQLRVFQQQESSSPAQSNASFSLNVPFRSRLLTPSVLQTNSNGRIVFSVSQADLQGIDSRFLVLVVNRVGKVPSAVLPFVAVNGRPDEFGNHTLHIVVPEPITCPLCDCQVCQPIRHNQAMQKMAASRKQQPSAEVGDTVTVTRPHTPLKCGRTTVATLPQSERLKIICINGGWVGTSVIVGGKKHSGWIWHENVHLSAIPGEAGFALILGSFGNFFRKVGR